MPSDLLHAVLGHCVGGDFLMVTKLEQRKIDARNPEKVTTKCPGGGDHAWVVKQANGTKSLQDKIRDLAASPSGGDQHEAAAAQHNASEGTLNDSKDMSEGPDKVLWVCAICSFEREADHVTTDASGNKSAVEAKAKTAMDERDARQLGRNCQALGQGAVSGVTYKVPSGPAHNVLVHQIKEIASSLGQAISVVRV
jgi:hypothetical protein